MSKITKFVQKIFGGQSRAEAATARVEKDKQRTVQQRALDDAESAQKRQEDEITQGEREQSRKSRRRRRASRRRSLFTLFGARTGVQDRDLG